ncbi:alpha-2,8-polysialyltransferase family protein [Chromohalobacter israelensis]|uniref:alpha-2,8-polysialyltransferase family protein n=1 Tax=Chromohalobacter israelensis TaxID=141390 RepID=UPI001CC36A2B|nr:alpha-2,8-polysialyltransferase family protein [Chromohalobacter salexigens]MBZ5876641.1 alpha-2,8-polysialyltransferase family protein [Chromohalobacter salexigens]
MHFFICHTPFQRFFARCYAGSLEEKFYIIYEQGEGKGESDENEYLLPGFKGFFDSKHVAKKNGEFIKEVIKKKTQGEEFFVYLSDLRWPTNNFLYFSSSLVKRENTFMFVDGLGSYLDRSKSFIMFSLSVVKFLLSLLPGYAIYRPFLGNYFGYDKTKAHKVIGPNSRNIIGNARKEEFSLKISTNKEEANASDKSVIFLGQPLTGPDAKNISMSAIKKVQKLGYEKKYYKPHHFENEVFKEYFSDNGFEIITDKRPFEEVLLTSSYECVCSYFSSSLPFSKFMTNNEVRAVSVCFHEAAKIYMRKRDRERLLKILVDSGVEIE